MDEIIERLARECAESLVSVDLAPMGMSYVRVAGLSAGPMTAARAAWDAPGAAGDLAAAVAAALRRLRDAMNALPLPSPVSAERLAEIREDRLLIGAWPSRQADRAVDDLSAHVAHLERLVLLLAQESEGLAFAAGLAEGRRLGAKEQREADVAAMADWEERFVSLAHAARCLGKEPLVTDAGGPS